MLILIFIADRLNFEPISARQEFAYSSAVLFITFIFVFTYQELAGKRFKLATLFSYAVAIILYTISISYIAYAISFDTMITEDIIYAISQTNVKESIEFTEEYISPLWIIVVLFSTIFMGYLLLKQEGKETSKIEKSLLLFIVVLTLGMAGVQRQDIRLFSFAIDGVKHYAEELELFRETQEKRKTGVIEFEATKDKKGETYIVIIGESLNKKHMGIYDYMRDTTPLLSEKIVNDELLLFTNAYSNHTHTMPVLSLSLTEANQYNDKNYYDSLSIINILNKSEIETYWISNQNLYGVWDNLVSIIAHESDHLVALNRTVGESTKTQKHDEDLIDEVKNILSQKTDKNRVIFVHLIGNHGAYSSRYPKDKYTIFNGTLKLGEFGTEASKNTNINDYDNSVLYNDYVVNSILEELQKEKAVNGFIYMSDHADDVIGKLGHNSGKFTYEMAQIPMIAWFSDKYRKEYRNKYTILSNHRNTLFSNDMLHDTMVGLFDVKTDKYNSKYDLTSKDYKLNSKDALVLHGKQHYIDKSNYIYWQKTNTQYLVDTNQSNRIFPHRVNSIGKLKDIWNDGFKSFELDTRFGDNNTTFFQMGHNDGVMGIKMEDFLLSVDYSKIERVWLDFKNLNQNNYKEAIKRLEYLDKKYDIKKKFIVESGTTFPFFKEVRKSGWHTSYYMPTEKIVKLLKDKNIKGMNALAKNISNQTKYQKVSAVSFDHRLYPFVKEYLEPLIDKDVVYHIWHAPSLSSNSFQQDLQKNRLYMDKRIKTLLTRYKSQFNL